MDIPQVYWNRKEVDNHSTVFNLLPLTNLKAVLLSNEVALLFHLEDNLMSLFSFQVYELFESRTLLFCVLLIQKL